MNDRDEQGADTVPVEVWSNDTYFTHAVSHNGAVHWLSIRRHDWKPVLDWRDKQAIKNQIAGPECEAAELYPAESRLVDTCNWAHLICLPPGEKFPFGWTKGKQTEDCAREAQRPLTQRGDCSPLRPAGRIRVPSARSQGLD